MEWQGSSGPTSLFASASYRRSDVGLSPVDGSADPEHDRTHQLEGFAFIDHVIGEESRLSLILGTSNERFELPGLPGAAKGAARTKNPRSAHFDQHVRAG